MHVFMRCACDLFCDLQQRSHKILPRMLLACITMQSCVYMAKDELVSERGQHWMSLDGNGVSLVYEI